MRDAIEKIVDLIKNDTSYVKEVRATGRSYITDDPKVPNGFQLVVGHATAGSGFMSGGTSSPLRTKALANFVVKKDENNAPTILASDSDKAEIVKVLNRKTVDSINELTNNSLPEKPGYQPPPLHPHV